MGKINCLHFSWPTLYIRIVVVVVIVVVIIIIISIITFAERRYSNARRHAVTLCVCPPH